MLVLPRVYPILDTAALDRHGLAADQVAQAWIDGGARILQYRRKGPFTRTALNEARHVGRLCAESNVACFVNDRADIAALLGTGVHLGQDDLRPSEARPFTTGPMGYSTHNAAQLLEAKGEPANYLALGPIFATASKEKPDRVVGLQNLRAWRGLTDRPLVAIGGITRETAETVIDAGADSVAVIADMLPDSPTLPLLRRRMEEWTRLLN